VAKTRASPAWAGRAGGRKLAIGRRRFEGGPDVISAALRGIEENAAGRELKSEKINQT
jgi:hypothetical protein